jgi:hypothetical protein
MAYDIWIQLSGILQMSWDHGNSSARHVADCVRSGDLKRMEAKEKTGKPNLYRCMSFWGGYCTILQYLYIYIWSPVHIKNPNMNPGMYWICSLAGCLVVFHMIGGWDYWLSSFSGTQYLTLSKVWVLRSSSIKGYSIKAVMLLEIFEAVSNYSIREIYWRQETTRLQ